MRGFTEISYDDMCMYHPKSNGILKLPGHVSLYICKGNSQGYEDAFSADGNILNYVRAKNKRDNLVVDRNVDGDFKVYLNNGNCWYCGKYKVTDSFGWGWTLKRI